MPRSDTAAKETKRLLKKLERNTKNTDSVITGFAAAKPPLRRRIARIALISTAALALACVVVPPYVYPVYGPVTSHFFIRNNPQAFGTIDLEIHEGIDIAAGRGTPVTAAKSGRVTAAGWSETLGNYIEIAHWLGFSTRYAHLDSISVAEGGFVLKGITRIGAVGSTGRSTGPHLHFEVRWNSRPLPPGAALLFARIRRTIFGF